jgi:dihydrofolate reductase
MGVFHLSHSSSASLLEKLGVKMRNLVLFMHTSLDGFVAGPNGEMDWINVDEEIFDYAEQRTQAADTALYGRVTYQMMEGYWPTAADQPNPTRHDIQHSKWYKNVAKVVLSRTMQGAKLANTQIISDHLVEQINQIKQGPGKEIVIFGSPSAAHSLMRAKLIDDFWLFVNPVLLGRGIPVFKDINDKTDLTLVKSHVFSSGVICLHYTLKRES